jgi:hypothetical protein
MEKDQILLLLEKYFEGLTSLEEEKTLQSYFADQQEIDSALLPLKKHFELLRKGRELPFKSDLLNAKILVNIKNYENSLLPPSRKLNISRFLIAASVAALIGISGLIFLKTQHKQIEDTYSDPHLAYIETQKALLFVSQKMNKGIEPLSKISKINTGAEQLKNLEKMDKSLNMLHIVSFINKTNVKN